MPADKRIKRPKGGGIARERQPLLFMSHVSVSLLSESPFNRSLFSLDRGSPSRARRYDTKTRVAVSWNSNNDWETSRDYQSIGKRQVEESNDPQFYRYRYYVTKYVVHNTSRLLYSTKPKKDAQRRS